MNTRLIAYPAIVVSTLLLVGLSSCDFPRSARLHTMSFPRPGGDLLLSPDGRLLASVEAPDKTTVLRVDSAQPTTLLTVDYPVALSTADHPDTPVQFSTHSAHLLFHNATGFRVVDLATRQTVDFRLPPSPKLVEPAPDAEPVYHESFAQDAPLRPITEDGAKPEAEEYFQNPPTEATPIARAMISSTARYVVLQFANDERVALLEMTADGYAFRRWIPVGSKSLWRFTFAGDDSMAAFVTDRGIKTCRLPSGRVRETYGGDYQMRKLTNAVLMPHPTSEYFACVPATSGGSLVAINRFNGTTQEFSPDHYGNSTIVGTAHLAAPNGPLIYPEVQDDLLVAKLLYQSGSDSRVDRFEFEHDSALRSGGPRYYLGSGLSPEGRLLRLATRNATKDTVTIDTIDLDIVGAQTEDQRESYSTRWQLAFTGGVVLLCLVFEGTLFLGRRRETLRLRAIDDLFDACTSGKTKAVQKLIKGRGANTLVQARNRKGVTPLLVAAGLGHTEIIESLLAAGADLEASDPAKQGTALTYACCVPNRDESGALVLLAHGASVRARTKDGVTAAKLAAERGMTKVLAAIAAKDPAALALANDEGVTPAYSAAEGNHADCLEFCAKHAPASLEVCRKEDHASPAYVAAFHGHEAALAVIAAAAPAALRIPGPQDYLPATIAAQKGHTACVRIIAQHAPETFAITVDGDKRITPAFLAAQNGHHETLEAIATVAPATLGQPRANDSVTPAYQAAFKGHARCLESIARHAPESLLVRNNEQHLPAFVAAQNGHISCLDVLQKFAPASLSDPTEGSPAFIAAQLNQLAALRYLLKVVPESFDALFSGNNPAHVAAVQGHEEVYALLAAERPALLAVANPAGKTPVQLRDEALAERKAKEEQEAQAARSAANRSAGVILWGIGFNANAEMLRSAVITAAQGNMVKMIVLLGLPAETLKLDANPSEVEAALYYLTVARLKGWKQITPKFQFLGLPDGRKLLLAYPPIG